MQMLDMQGFELALEELGLSYRHIAHRMFKLHLSGPFAPGLSWQASEGRGSGA